MPEVDVNAVVERLVEVEQPPVEQPQGVPAATVAVYDYPLSNDEVVTLSENEHLRVTHAPDPATAFYLVWESRDAVPDEDVPDATPAAVEEADKADIDLDAVEGTGKDGRVTKADVVAAEDSVAPEAPGTDDPVPVETEDEPPAPPASAQTDKDGPAPDRQV